MRPNEKLSEAHTHLRVLEGKVGKVVERLSVIGEAMTEHERVVGLGDYELELEQLGRGRAARRLVGVAHDEGRVAEERVGRDEQVEWRAAADLRA